MKAGEHPAYPRRTQNAQRDNAICLSRSADTARPAYGVWKNFALIPLPALVPQRLTRLGNVPGYFQSRLRALEQVGEERWNATICSEANNGERLRKPVNDWSRYELNRTERI